MIRIGMINERIIKDIIYVFMKKILCILLLFVFLSETYSQDIPLWFSDDFKDNVNRWYMVEEYGEKTYHNALFVNDEKDFRLVAQFNTEDLFFSAKNEKYGLSWGRKDLYKYFHFEVNSKKQFRIGYVKGKDFNSVEAWSKKQKCITEAVNVLEVRKKGPDWLFYINDKMVSKMPARSFDFSGIALKSSSPDVVFNSFSIYQDMGPVNLVKGIDIAENTERKNLGNLVNSRFVDKSPSISPDGKTLYFVREDADDGFGGQDIYFSRRKDNGEWEKAENIDRPLNNRANNFVNSVMPDNNTLMTINSYQRSSNDEVLAFTYRTKDGWSSPTGKSIRKLQHVGRWVSFDLAADGKTLVFSMKRPDTHGGRDLYVSFLQKDGNFSLPRNLGTTLNTSGNEHSPFMAADGKTLYFDTDGHPGYGGRDIFMSKRLDDSWTNWSVPQNLGPGINTKGADESLVLPASGEFAYFVSDKKSFGAYDIYSLKLPQALKPEPTSIISGYVVNCLNQRGIETKIHVYKNGLPDEDAYARSSPVNGAFKLALAGGAKYMIIAEYNKELETSNADTIYIDLSDLDKYEERELQPICLQKKKKVEEPAKIPIRAQNSHTPVFESVYFQYDKHVLDNDALNILNKMVDTLKAYPDFFVEVLGHTDSNGSHLYNLSLAMNRTTSVIAFLEKNGIPSSRLLFKGFGETKPVEDNLTHSGRAKNRRVEFVAVQKKSS